MIGYEWDEESPRIQLEPRGERGYIELRAIKKQQSNGAYRYRKKEDKMSETIKENRRGC